MTRVPLFLRHIYAIIYRQMLIFSRSKSQLLKSALLTILSSAAALTFQIAATKSDHLLDDYITFRDFRISSPSICIISKQETFILPFTQLLISDAKDMILNETGFLPLVYNFSSQTDFDEWIYIPRGKGINSNRNVVFGFSISSDSSDSYQITVLHRQSPRQSLVSLIQMQRLLFKRRLNDSSADVSISFSELISHLSGSYVSSAVPIFVTYGVLNICSLFISQIIDDISSERRPYMKLCSMSIFSYWLGSFIADYVIWLLTITGFWLIYLASDTPLFTKFPFISWEVLALSGPGIILLFFCISFIFSSPATGSHYAQMMVLFPIFILGSKNLTGNQKFDRLLEKVGSVYPVSYLFSSLTKLAEGQSISFLPVPLAFVLLMVLLYLIEYTLDLSERAITSASFSLFRNQFLQLRSKNKGFGIETLEQKVLYDKDPSLRITNACRHFLSQGQIIAAVNHVSLCINSGEIFGLLGANGSGKSTLMKLIYGRMPLSFGTIERSTDGVALCPQFDDHLSPLLTARENLIFFSLLYGNDKGEIQNYIDALDLEEHSEKQIVQLSGGNARKVSIIVALISGRSIIMLDEPTSSLDPIARHRVHDLIKEMKGRQTVLLCTHLLEEAENLCDSIGVMINGSIYAYGSPRELQSHYGKDWKIDVVVADPTQETRNSVNSFVIGRFPDAKVLFNRQRTVIYSIPCNAGPLSSVFKVMQEGMDAKCGIKYFTCSSSTLEKVFLELIKAAESQRDITNEM